MEQDIEQPEEGETVADEPCSEKAAFQTESEESWALVEGWHNYHVSTRGRIRNSERRLMKPQTGPAGYLRVGLTRDGTQKQFYMHQLVAKAFIMNPERKPLVNHINGDRVDNRVENLEWATHAENASKKARPMKTRRGRKVVQLSKSLVLIKVWDSASAAAQALGVNRANLSKSCKQTSHTVGGCYWRFFDEYTPSDPDEEWRPMPVDGRPCFVSSFGRLRTPSGDITHGSPGSGYMYYNNHRVHILVAEAFHPKPESEVKLVVNHKDGNKLNNRSDNLEWLTPAANTQHGLGLGLNSAARRVRRVFEDGTTASYCSVNEAARQSGISASTISRACNSALAGASSSWVFEKETQAAELTEQLEQLVEAVILPVATPALETTEGGQTSSESQPELALFTAASGQSGVPERAPPEPDLYALFEELTVSEDGQAAPAEVPERP